MYRTRTIHSFTVGDVECELMHEPVGGSELTAQVGDNIVVAYLVYDNDCDLDDMLGDCMGKMYSFHRFSKDADEGMVALGNTRDGEKDLEAVWRNHEAEAIRRYIECVLSDHTDEDTVVNYEETQNCEPRDGETLAERARRYVTADAEEAYSWNYVSEEDTMRDVLEKIWDEPEFFPGDRDAQVLACYEHSGQHWSLSGQGTQCRWDTSNKAGAWVPDDCLREELDSAAPRAVYALVKGTSWIRGKGQSYQLLEVKWSDDMNNEQVSVKFSDDPSELHVLAEEIAAGKPTPTTKQLRWGRAEQAKIYCQQFLDTYNDIISGQVYGCVVETFDLSGAQVEEDACWGFVGDYAKEALKSEYFEPACVAAEKVGDCV